MPVNNDKNRQAAQGFSNKEAHQKTDSPSTKVEPSMQVDEQTLGRAMTVYKNRQGSISNSVGNFLTQTVDEVDQGVRGQVRDGFGALTEAAVVAFVEETVAMDSQEQVGGLTAPKYQFKSLSSRKSLSQLNSLLPGSKDQPQLTAG